MFFAEIIVFYYKKDMTSVKMVCYTCGVTILGTRYCSSSPLCCFSYVHCC